MPATLLALAPKCLLCFIVYAGLGAALGLGGPELCGGPAEPGLHWSSWLALTAVVGCGAGLSVHFLQRIRAGTVRVSSAVRKSRTR